MTDTTQTVVQARPEYIEDLDVALLAEIFGTPDKDGNLKGGILDPKAFPDLFNIPDYKQAGPDVLQRAVTNSLDTKGERQAFFDRYLPYFQDAQGDVRYIPDAASGLEAGQGTISDALTDYFPDAKTYLESGRGGINAEGIYDTALRDAERKADAATKGFDARGRSDSLFAGARGVIRGGLGQFNTNPSAYDDALQRIQSGQGAFGVNEGNMRRGTETFNVDEGAFDKGQNMMRGAQGEFGLSGGLADARANVEGAAGGRFAARKAFERGTGRSFELAEQGLGSFDPSTAAQSFMDPYKEQVIDAALDKINREGAKRRQGDAAKAISQGAFGGSRAGVQAAETARAIEETKQSTVANLMSQGYDKAMANAMATDEAARKRALQASGITGQLGAQGAGLESRSFEDAAKRGLAAATTSAGLSQTEEQIRQKAFEDAKARGLQGAQLSNAVAETLNKLGMSAFESGATRTMSAEQQINAAKQKAFEDAKARGLTGAQMETVIAKAGEDARQQAYEDAQRRDITGGQALARIGSEQLGAESSAFADKQKRMLQVADMYRSMGLSSAEAEVRAAEDEKKRDLEAGRLVGGLGQTIGQLGGAQADIGQAYGQLGATSADIGRVYAGLQPADMGFMYELGGKERGYDQQAEEYRRLNALSNTQEALAPYSYAQNFLTGAPSASMYSQYTQVPQTQTNPFYGGVGMYATMQGINQQK